MKPVMIDGFGCQGGAAKGYQQAGFYVIGIEQDRKHAKRYAGDEIIVGDVFEVLPRLVAELREDGEDVRAHVSPPCQPDTAGLRAHRARGVHLHGDSLIARCRAMLQALEVPYVIENVEGARKGLVDPILLCGTMFGLSTIDDDGTPLEMWRHRLFESSEPLGSYTCQHGEYAAQVAGSYGGARRDKHEARNVRHGGYVPAKHVQERLLGIDWMTQYGLYQSLPPVYTRWIGAQLLEHLRTSRGFIPDGQES